MSNLLYICTYIRTHICWYSVHSEREREREKQREKERLSHPLVHFSKRLQQPILIQVHAGSPKSNPHLSHEWHGYKYLNHEHNSLGHTWARSWIKSVECWCPKWQASCCICPVSSPENLLFIDLQSVVKKVHNMLLVNAHFAGDGQKILGNYLGHDMT